MHVRVALNISAYTRTAILQTAILLHPNYAMTSGGRWDKYKIRVSALSDEGGDGHGRKEFEQEYYQDILMRIAEAKKIRTAPPKIRRPPLRYFALEHCHCIRLGIKSQPLEGIMTAKGYLKQAYEAKVRMEDIQGQIDALDDKMTKLGHSVSDGSKVQSTPPRDPMGDRLAALIDEKTDRLKQYQRWEHIYSTAERILNAVECVSCYKVLHARYMCGLKLEEIAGELNYTVSYVRKLHFIGFAEIKDVS